MVVIKDGAEGDTIYVSGFDKCPDGFSYQARCINLVGGKVHVLYANVDKVVDEYWEVISAPSSDGR